MRSTCLDANSFQTLKCNANLSELLFLSSICNPSRLRIFAPIFLTQIPNKREIVCACTLKFWCKSPHPRPTKFTTCPYLVCDSIITSRDLVLPSRMSTPGQKVSVLLFLLQVVRYEILKFRFLFSGVCMTFPVFKHLALGLRVASHRKGESKRVE